MKLFDDISRARDINSIGSISNLGKFTLLNGYDVFKEANGIRKKIESWFTRVPESAKSDLRSRLRSNDDRVHLGAFFELFLHELFVRVGYKVDVHPKLESGNTPDFRVIGFDACFYVEAAVVQPQEGSLFYGRNESDVIEKLNSLSSADFMIGLHMEGELKKTIGRKKLVKVFADLLASHDPNEVRCQLESGGLYATPSKTIHERDWALTGWLYPANHRLEKFEQTQGIVIAPYRPKEIRDPILAVQRVLATKGSKYSNLDAPYWLAIHPYSPYAQTRGSDFAALYSRRHTLEGFRHEAFDQLDGFWGWPQAADIAGVWRFGKVDWQNMFNASANLYLNPNSGSLIPAALRQFSNCAIEDGKLRWSEGDSIPRLLGVNP